MVYMMGCVTQGECWLHKEEQLRKMEMGAGNTNPFLLIELNGNGTIKRPPLPTRPTSSDPAHVLSTDVPLNPSKSTYIRIYLPAAAHSTSNLPLVVFFHGGFILFSPDYSYYHDFCERLAAGVPAVVASVSYRLAPESRLPGAYEDAADALEFLRATAAEAPLAEDHPLGRVDFTRCYLMGSSAGANIIYHVAQEYYCPQRGMETRSSLLRVAGLMLHQPAFGGEARTASELAGYNDAFIPIHVTDMIWSLTLPEGADRDHPFCNPMKQAATVPGAVAGLATLPRCLVTANVEDPLVDRDREFVRMLESAGVNVKARLDGKGGHAAELFDAEVSCALICDVRAFIE